MKRDRDCDKRQTMKKFTFKGVLDNFRTSVAQPTRPDQEIQETLRSENFQVKRTFRHGFPFQPTSVAFDPIQRLLAIGSKCGSLRILGQPGTDVHVRHDMDGPPGSAAVLQVQFLVNEGALITATADDTLHLWNFRQKVPQVVHALKFQKEKLTAMHLPLQSKWLYVGTERGNVHVVNIESFTLSGYLINWNKAMELTRKTHPGPVIHLSDNPLDASKLLIGFESGLVALWDLRSKLADIRIQTAEHLRSIAWHHEGKQFMCSHADGSLTTWSVRQNAKPVHVSYPHAKINKDGKLEQCKPIGKVEWKLSRSGEAFVIFSGGMPTDQAGRTPSITVVHSKTTTVLEMEHPVIDFITLCESPYVNELQEPYAIIALLQNDLVVIDLQTSGFPCLENPYPMDIHESAVTCCSYLADCPADLIPAFYSVGRSGTTKRQEFSERDWPISGGTWSSQACSYNEIIITGHADGSIKFWDASAGTLQVLYKLKTAKIFERPKSRTSSSSAAGDDDPFAVQLISLCPESRKLAVGGASSHVVLFAYKKSECVEDVTVLEIPIVYEIPDEGECSPDCQFSGPGSAGSGNKIDLFDMTDNKKETSLRVKVGPQKKPAGFQAQLVCLTPWNSGEPPGRITALTINSSYGLMAYGNEAGMVIVDIEQKVCLINVGSPDLYGAQDPYSRVPRSPKKSQQNNNATSGFDGATLPIERDERHPRSPSIDQLGRSPEPQSPISSSSPCPATTPVEPAIEATEDMCDHQSSDNVVVAATATIAPPQQQQQQTSGRRKSAIAWRSTWNLKRQLSKVDLKIKVGGTSKSHKDKRHSIFYCSESQDNGNRDNDDDVAEEGNNSKSSPESDESTLVDKSPMTPGGGGGDDDDDEPDVALLASDEEANDALIVGSLGTQYEIAAGSNSNNEKKVCFGSSGNNDRRPHNLDLTTDANGCPPPIRPPRHFKKRSQTDAKTRRDQRLLSVPIIKYNQQRNVLRDLRDKEEKKGDCWNQQQQQQLQQKEQQVQQQKEPQQPTFAGQLMRRFSRVDKLDSSFSRSRSSSMSSLENITSEAIQCLAFADSYTRRSEPSLLTPTLWIGTSLGSVLTVLITPPDSDSRSSQPVVVSLLGGTIFRLKGSILTMAFLDCNGALIPYTYEPWKDENRETRRDRTPTRNQNRMSPTFGGSGDGGRNSENLSDRQFVVLASEKQARVVALPSQTCIYRQQLADTDFVVKAETISIKDSVCLVCYVSNGHLVAYSLPSLRPLIDIDFLPLSELRITRTFCFTNRGHGLYLASPSEIQKFTLCAEFCTELTKMLGELFLALDMPEPPKESFFKGLFGGGTRSLDREELFGESSGKASKSVAVYKTPLQDLNSRSNNACSEISRAHKLAMERGDKLNQLEERAEKMRNEAENFASGAHELMNKYKEKKWYQL